MGTVGLVVLVIVVVLLLTTFATGFRVINEYERGVVFRLGRLIDVKGPGPRLIIPFGIDRLLKIDLRINVHQVPPQDIITKDNVTVRVTAVVFFRVVDARDAYVKVNDYRGSISTAAQTTLRSILGQSTLDELLSQRDKVNAELQAVIDEQTEPWGVKVTAVEVKDVDLPQSMQRAMAMQAEAEREKRAKIIRAEGEFLAAQQLSNAAEVIGREPATLQLRYLQTLAEIGAEQNTVVVFPLPLDLIQPFLEISAKAGDHNGHSAAAVRAITEKVLPKPGPRAPKAKTD
ncbi:MAG TPA: slipin family protein [Candidatus Dormibacteraeota bacterium]|nr:slipin family protein [Candidatus Dormibacteraeota bacterium]